jgi:FlaA1/EpsC-like NDP-sugar epimerase
MTRFFITLEKVADFIVQSMTDMIGKEIFIPWMKAANIMTVAEAAVGTSNFKYEEIGMRGDEKLHEVLVTEMESRHTEIDEENQRYVIRKDTTYNQPEFIYHSNADLVDTGPP